jgi:hypothetical protein
MVSSCVVTCGAIDGLLFLYDFANRLLNRDDSHGDAMLRNRYHATGDAAHAAKSAEIMDAWSAVLVKHNNSNGPLQSAWAGAVFPRAAEVIRHTWEGWPAANVARFERMLQTAYLPMIIDGCFGYNGNWELSMAEAIAAIAVFCEDSASFEQALSLWRGRVSSSRTMCRSPCVENG